MAYFLCYLENSTATEINNRDEIINELETLKENERYSIWSKQDINKLLNKDLRAPIKEGVVFRELFTDNENIESWRDYRVIRLMKQLYFNNDELLNLSTSLDFAKKYLEELAPETKEQKETYTGLLKNFSILQETINRAYNYKEL